MDGARYGGIDGDNNDDGSSSSGPQRPPCVLLVPFKDGLQGAPFPMNTLTVRVECHTTTAFVSMEGTWRNPTGEKTDVILILPTTHETSLTSVVIQMGARVVETMVVPLDEAQTYATEQNNLPFERYHPDTFRLPIKGLAKNEEIRVSVNYFEKLEFHEGSYHVVIPLAIPFGVLTGPPEQSLKVFVHINCATPYCKWGSSSHPLITRHQSEGRIELESDNSQAWNLTDFRLSYTICTDEILASLLLEPAIPDTIQSYDPRGTFALFVSPPVVSSVSAYFGRSVVFIVDKSGSMSGEPMEAAKNALVFGLDRLAATDHFTIIAFDNSFVYYKPDLERATQENIEAAKQWVRTIHAGGLTDIMTPLSDAIQKLETALGVPYVFLITDGAVRDERLICQWVKEHGGPVRVMTFGIGPYCNAFFLKMLAEIGRGFSDVALPSNKIYKQITQLLAMAETPILTDVKIGITGLHGCEVYPFPIPDLFCGAPLVISGKFEGVFPPAVTLVGTLPGGSPFERVVPANRSPFIPVNKVFVKQRLDLLTAQAWLTSSEEIRREVVELSCSESVPCAHTTMVAYEVNPKAKEARRNKQGGPGKRAAIGGAAALAVGGVVVLGASAMHFGDIGATISNIGSGLSDGLGGVSDVFASAGGTLLNGLEGAGSAVIDGAEFLGSNIATAVEAVGDGIQDVAEGCCTLCSDAAGCCSGIGDGCGDGCSDLAEIVKSAAAWVGDLLFDQ
eukprot:TRINITY_DN6653_c0_g1_i2.p1 TRINITY_DN6653_c0_g1~~TRINITY_DN6653_c0_g1_i2.p1  ORF type:complete len:733 (+),score=117.11 TRINITY_DN6653_c0_g1_i2:2-2200(+)